MLRTTRPDNGVYPSSVITSDIDLAELAARTSYNRLRRSGRVVYTTDFISNIGWNLYGSAGYVAEIRSNYAPSLMSPLTPPGMLRFVPGTTTPFDVYAQANMPDVINNKIGIEVTFMYDDQGTPQVLDYFDIYYNGSGYTGAIRYDLTGSGMLQYLHEATWVDFSAQPYTFAPHWINLKVVMDITNGFYSYCMFNRQIIPMTDHLQPNLLGYSYIRLYAKEPNTNVWGVFVDSVIVTTDES